MADALIVELVMYVRKSQLEIPGIGDVFHETAKRKLPNYAWWKHMNGKTSKVQVIGPHPTLKDHFHVIDHQDVKRALHRDQISFIKSKPISKSLEYSVVMNSVNKKYDGRDLSHLSTKDRIKNNPQYIAPIAGGAALTGMSIRNYHKANVAFLDSHNKMLDYGGHALSEHLDPNNKITASAFKDQEIAAWEHGKKLVKRGNKYLAGSAALMTAGMANNVRVANKRHKLYEQKNGHPPEIKKSMNQSRFGGASAVAKGHAGDKYDKELAENRAKISTTHTINRNAFRQGVKGGLIVGVPTTAAATYGAVKGKQKLSEIKKASMGAARVFEGAANDIRRAVPVGHGTGGMGDPEVRRSIREHAAREMQRGLSRGKEVAVRAKSELADTRPPASKRGTDIALRGKNSLVSLRQSVKPKPVKASQELLPIKQGTSAPKVEEPLRSEKASPKHSFVVPPKPAATGAAPHAAPPAGPHRFDEGVKTKSYVPHALAAAGVGTTAGVAITDPQKRKNWASGAKSQIHELTKAENYDASGNPRQSPTISGNTALGLAGVGTVALGARTLGRAGNLPHTAARNANLQTNNLLQQQGLNANKEAARQAAEAKAAKAKTPWGKSRANKQVDRAIYHESRQNERLIAQEGKTTAAHDLAHAVKPRMKMMRNGGLAMVAGGTALAAGALHNAGKNREVPQ